MLDGDIVDENTTTAQMGSAFQILSTIDSKYGIYYTYGNHDKNNYATTPNYTADQLAETIKENSIQILEDDTTIINDEIALIGRADRGDRSADRQAISDLTSELNGTGSSTIVLLKCPKSRMRSHIIWTYPCRTDLAGRSVCILISF